MALTGWSTSNYLRRLFQVYDTYPFIISWWMKPSTLNDAVIVSVGLTSAGGDQRRGEVGIGDFTGAGQVFAQSRSTGGAAANTVAITAGAWIHGYGEFISTASRAASFNGANRATNTGSISPSASDSLHIGVRTDVVVPFGATDGLAEISIWNGTGMSDAKRASLSTKLAAGQNPINVNAEAGQPWTGLLVAYWPLASTADLTDNSANTHDLTMVGTLTNYASHPTIDAVSTSTVTLINSERGVRGLNRGLMRGLR
jgi:hypothetical protein